jgi:hypothetical protein
MRGIEKENRKSRALFGIGFTIATLYQKAAGAIRRDFLLNKETYLDLISLTDTPIRVAS